ncbi:MAG: endonuclease Q family protein [Candidatus Omnitrophica bacterium]|nr:endonuclease Q family protein [Candidatus Omnitrophota bacterium]
MYSADFHIHSQFSRATSKGMNIPELDQWARVKGIRLLGTGDFTHFLWLHQLREQLIPTERIGIYRYGQTDFLLTAEVCLIFDRRGQAKKVHTILMTSSIKDAEKLNSLLERYGDLNVDGRPILHLEAEELIRLVGSVDEHGLVIPAHSWTPHFSLFGANSGFDRIEDCFGNLCDEIVALETGLSSDPAMNWLCSRLDKYSLISNSDAHSPQKIGREMNVFQKPFDLPELKKILKTKDSNSLLFTVEYFPEEGKYHYDGHRNCQICFSPEETKKHNYICPRCGRSLTVGVLHRVKQLADRPEGRKPERWVDFKKIVPLDQILSSVLNKPAESVTVQNLYQDIVHKFGSEFTVLLEVSESDLRAGLSPEIAEGICLMRQGKVSVSPGYDGKFGKVEILLQSGQGENQPALF